MYRELAPDVLKEMENIGRLMFIPDNVGGVAPKPWQGPVKYRVLFFIADSNEHLFDCYVDESGETIQITGVEPSDWMKEQSKGVLDGYVYIMLRNATRFAAMANCERIIISSYLPMFPEHLIDLGFQVRARTISGQVQGFKSLRKE